MSAPAEDNPAAINPTMPEPIADAGPARGSVDVAVIIFKALGVYSILQILPDLFSLITIIGTMSVDPSVFARFALAVGFAIVPGLLLIFASNWLAKVILGGEHQSIVRMPSRGVEWQAIAFSVAGLLVVSHGLSALGSAVSAMIRVSREAFAPKPDYTPLIAPLFQIGIGVAIFLRAKGLAMLWHQIRYRPPTLAQPEDANTPRDSE